MIHITTQSGHVAWINPRYVLTITPHTQHALCRGPKACTGRTEIEYLVGSEIQTYLSVTPPESLVERIEHKS